jgi:hypothetical protein
VTISSAEQYESILGVLNLLRGLSVPKTDELFEDIVMESSCTNCEKWVEDCRCDDDAGYHGRHYAEYDDEASYE